MAVDRERLEAVIRQQVTRSVIAAIRNGAPSTPIMNQATSVILAAAADYGLTAYGITADRRAVLAAAFTMTHYQRGGHGQQACGSRAAEPADTTLDLARVNCRRCRNTRAFKAAAAVRILAGAS